MVVRCVIDATVPMRAASRISGLINVLNGDDPHNHPSHTTVQNFILRIGLYLLQRDTLHGHDWIWIADHTYSVGTTKVFVVLGITLTDFQQLRRPLEHHDLEVLTLLPVEQSNGTIVHQQMSELAGRVGVPLAILSDRGSDLNKGVSLLRKDQPTVISLYDIVHLTSRKIEKVLDNDPQWAEFRKACCQCANAVRQSPLAHLKPPRPKTKARYMNIDREVRWGARALLLLDRVRENRLTDQQRVRLPKDLIEEKFGWLDEYRSVLEQWEHLSLTGRQVISEVRRQGYGSDTVSALETLARSTSDESCGQLFRQIIDDVQPMCDISGRHGRLPASSEVLESLFGKGKRLLSGTSSGTTNSLTRQMLAMVTSTARITPTLVQKALASCSLKNLLRWSDENFRPSLHVTRRKDLSPTETEQKLRKPKPAAIANF
jgi:hypothetical protein|tara:strand:- start:34 stop:1326 length:1293 start_codon:yes stop_codon:yes gene_type:complete